MSLNKLRKIKQVYISSPLNYICKTFQFYRLIMVHFFPFLSSFYIWLDGLLFMPILEFNIAAKHFVKELVQCYFAWNVQRRNSGLKKKKSLVYL